MKLKVSYQKNDPKSLIKALANGYPQGGSITLDDFSAHLNDVPRRDVVSALKSSKEGVFVVGRKGHASRWVYGAAAQAESEKYSIRSARKIATPRRPRTSLPEPETIGLGNGQMLTNLNLKVNVGGQETVIPIQIGLVPAGE